MHPLEGIVDLAALFPPASLGVPEALAEDLRLRASDEGWMVGRFVCRASQLALLGDAPLRLTVVLDGSSALPDDSRIEAVEVPPSAPIDSPAPVDEVYVERPVTSLDWLDEVAAVGRRAKVRCGGANVPSAQELAAFIRRCREQRIPFKATAGLHHPLRAGQRHGFLNLLAAAAFGAGDEEEALTDEDPSAFALGEGYLSWRGRRADDDTIAQVRTDVFASFGSCSVVEAVDDLRSLGLL